MFDYVLHDTTFNLPSTLIKIGVLGVGGGGSNAVQYMASQSNFEFPVACANTDIVHLMQSCPRGQLIQLGKTLAKGQGAGGSPEKGALAARESLNGEIASFLDGLDILFLTAGMGGGTGTGALPVIAQYAKERGIITIAVVTKPFEFELKKRMNVADQGIFYTQQLADAFVVIDNNRLISLKGMSMKEAFNYANEVLCSAVKAIAQVLYMPMMINLGFQDIKDILRFQGHALIGQSKIYPVSNYLQALESVLKTPLLQEQSSFKEANGALLSMLSGPDFSVLQLNKLMKNLKEYLDPKQVQFVWGHAISEQMRGKLQITLLLTGLGAQQMRLIDDHSYDFSTSYENDLVKIQAEAMLKGRNETRGNQ